MEPGESMDSIQTKSLHLVNKLNNLDFKLCKYENILT